MQKVFKVQEMKGASAVEIGLQLENKLSYLAVDNGVMGEINLLH